MVKFFIANELSQNPHRGAPQVIAIGNFDGIHQGHQELLHQALNQARKRGLPAVAVTFDPHPLAVLKPPHLRLFSLEDQQEQIRAVGLDGVVYLSFSRDFSELSAEDFLNRVIQSEFRPMALVVGYNFRFGAGRKGTIETLHAWGARNGCEIIVVDPITSASGPVSTSEIRRAILAGEVKKASDLLGRPYYLSGIVMHGDSRGRGLGFPTANLHLEKVVIPKWGVYATRTWVGGYPHPSVTHLGPLPTFHDEVVRLETHILNFSAEIYGQMLRVEFMDRVRDVRTFSSLVELREQISRDVETARSLLGVSG